MSGDERPDSLALIVGYLAAGALIAFVFVMGMVHAVRALASMAAAFVTHVG